MHRYVALLRGINVGGKNMLPMQRLRELVGNLGCVAAQTYLQSGNLLFESADTADVARRAIARVVAMELGTPIPILVRTAVNLAQVIAGNPFLLADPAMDPVRLHVTFLDGAPTPAVLARLALIAPSPKAPLDRFACIGDVVYLDCRGGYSYPSIEHTD